MAVPDESCKLTKDKSPVELIDDLSSFISDTFKNLSTPSESSVLDPLARATEVLDKVEALVADNSNAIDFTDQAAILLNVADRHINIGAQLLADFER